MHNLKTESKKTIIALILSVAVTFILLPSMLRYITLNKTISEGIHTIALGVSLIYFYYLNREFRKYSAPQGWWLYRFINFRNSFFFELIFLTFLVGAIAVNRWM